MHDKLDLPGTGGRRWPKSWRMHTLRRRDFLSQIAAVGLAATGCATIRTPATAHGRPASAVNIVNFGAVADGFYDRTTGQMGGTDNTDAINAALSSGLTVKIPPGLFYYSNEIFTDVDGSGLKGSGSRSSFLITDQSLDRHISIVQGTRNTRWTNFAMIGPFADDGNASNRALTVGVNRTRTTSSLDEWDATGTWVDDFAAYGYCVGMHVAGGSNVQFGTIEVFETGNSRAEPGSYGLTCSGSNLRGKVLLAKNTISRGRHALYYTGPANNCFVQEVEARGFDFAAIQNRATAGGGRKNGFDHGFFEDCNTNELDATTLRGVVNFSCAHDRPVDNAGMALIGNYSAVNCGGFPGPSLRYMPNSKCGEVQILGHSGKFPPKQIYGSHIFKSDMVRLPLLIFTGGLETFEYNSRNFRPLVIESSQNCYGGGVEFRP